MQRIGSCILLNADKKEEYVRLHAEIAKEHPKVLEALRRANIHNYSIFLRENVLFSYFEYDGDDFAADTASIAADEATQKWWKLTDPCQSPMPGEERDSNGRPQWSTMTKVFHMD